MADQIEYAEAPQEEEDRGRRALLPALVLVALIIILIFLLLNFLGATDNRSVVTRGRSSVVVPDVVGMSEDDAFAQLKSAGFEVDVNTRSIPTSEGVGNVLSQVPIGGEALTKGSTVSIVVASGGVAAIETDWGGRERPPTVPDVIGHPKSTAIDAISSAGYNTDISELVSDEVAVGLVITQNPSPGTNMDPGGTVSIVISAGKSVGKVTVPNIVGLTRAAATSKIKSVGLKPWAVYGTQAAGVGGMCSNQWPAAGTVVDAGTEVHFQTGY